MEDDAKWAHKSCGSNVAEMYSNMWNASVSMALMWHLLFHLLGGSFIQQQAHNNKMKRKRKKPSRLYPHQDEILCAHKKKAKPAHIKLHKDALQKQSMNWK